MKQLNSPCNIILNLFFIDPILKYFMQRLIVLKKEQFLRFKSHNEDYKIKCEDLVDEALIVAV